MSRVNNSVVFIIGPDLPSVPLLLLTHPGFALLKLISSYDVVCLLMYFSGSFSLLSHLDLFLISTLSFLCKISCPNFFCVYFIISFFLYYYYFFKIGLMGRVPCGGGGEQKRFLQYKLYTSNQSQILDCIQGERLHHSHSRCDEVCEDLNRDKSAGKC